MDSFEENLEVYIIVDPNNLRLLDPIKEEHLPAISVSKSKNVLLVAYFKLTTVKLICAFRKTVTSACGRCLGRKHLYTFTAVTSDVVVFSSI